MESLDQDDTQYDIRLVRSPDMTEEERQRRLGQALDVILDPVFDRLRKEPPNEQVERQSPQRYYTVTEFALEIDASAETVRCMVRDGLVEAHKQRERWCIPVAEVDRFRQSNR